MKVVLIDPYHERVAFAHVTDLVTFCKTRIKQRHKMEWQPLQPPFEDEEGAIQPGLVYGVDAEGLDKKDQRFFRLAQFPLTFAGSAVFLGCLNGTVMSCPKWFEKSALRRVLYCHPKTRLLGTLAGSDNVFGVETSAKPVRRVFGYPARP
jgi:hypothetical protein